MNIREASISEVNEIVNLCSIMHKESNYKNIDPDYNKSYEFIESSIIDKESFFIVLIEDNRIIGFFMAKLLEYFFSHERQAVDYLFFIKEEHRKKSGAYKLVSTYIKWAKKNNVREIILSSTTGVELEKIEKLYSKFNFKKVGVMFKLKN